MSQKNQVHPSGIKQSIVDKVVARRGQLHAFPELNPTKTALVVVDLDTGTVTRVDDEIKTFVPQINKLAKALKAAGGTVAWVTTPIGNASKKFRAIYGDELAAMYEEEGAEKGKARTIWHELETQTGDIFATKRGASAFFPGKSDLHDQLQARNIESILIVGAVTNVCCEASARDASELDYEVTLVSDCMWGHKDGQHEATLATFYRNYGDVRPSEEIVEQFVEM
ncbi:MAG TPA: isochorismatase family cysteine hydrolase [Candidatus Saccharimonadales bacterium]|nr:isochorismatase family cysteine hydrolase [Candidatus Saccharimonadales bacterium]